MKEILNFDKVYKINRLRRVNGEVIANEIIYIPKEISGELDKETVLGSIFKVLEDRGLLINHSESEIKAIIMDEYYMKLFEVDIIVPLIKTYGTTLDDQNKVLFIEESVYRSDKYILEVNISRREGILK
ncbi:UTRA domain-containing protein [Clostridium sp. LY3-2]|uniref:UTRA domain-containing protein n=1 Tax=Clostridium sp. LY3-2 TaxID=2942482 RepID=UPI0021535121|nr:UTRA domain-containing protein [Clostridium sp. LY3-2]MCR6516259.1 UTRA domain-containing protein [Clostridium sp. LY3-2]